MVKKKVHICYKKQDFTSCNINSNTKLAKNHESQLYTWD